MSNGQAILRMMVRPIGFGRSVMPVRAGAMDAVVPRDRAGRSLSATAWTTRVEPLVAPLVYAMRAFAARLLPGRTTAETADAEPRRGFEAEMLPHLDAAYRLARYLARSEDAAEDIVQDAYLRAFRGFETFRGDNARAWILTIVRNCHLNWRRQAAQGPRAAVPTGAGGLDIEDDTDPLAMIAAEGDPEQDLMRLSEAEAVRRVLMTLEEPVRAILVLRDLEDCSYRDIAEILDVPLGTVMSRLARARKRFEVAWIAAFGEGEGQ
jgi:RNA polymerase sigma-70 factor (ECF subfamily)